MKKKLYIFLILLCSCKAFEFQETSKLVNEFYLEFDNINQALRVCKRLDQNKGSFCPCGMIQERKNKYYIRVHRDCVNSYFGIFGIKTIRGYKAVQQLP